MNECIQMIHICEGCNQEMDITEAKNHCCNPEKLAAHFFEVHQGIKNTKTAMKSSLIGFKRSIFSKSDKDLFDSVKVTCDEFYNDLEHQINNFWVKQDLT